MWDYFIISIDTAANAWLEDNGATQSNCIHVILGIYRLALQTA